MEFELDIREEQATWAIGSVLVLILLLFGLAKIGEPLTPYSQAGVARTLRWSDWGLYQAEEIYFVEVAQLRSDVDELAYVLNSNQNPVQVQLLTDRVLRDTASGTPALATARQALSNAALDIRDWSTGILSREDAIMSLEISASLLE